MTKNTAYWLMKSEPDAYGWDDLVAEGEGTWDGVRNHRAANNLRAMQVGDQAFFYHSNEERAIVGVMTLVKLWHLDPADETGKFGMVDVAPVAPMHNPVSLATIKATKPLASMVLLRQSRLSVTPVAAKEWQEIMRLGG